MPIALRQTSDYRQSIESLFAEVGFSPGRRVFVKPNLCGREPVLPGENTSVEVMDALLAALLVRGSQVVIGHGELLGSHDQRTPFAETLRASGFDRYLARPGVRVLNLDELPRRAVATEEMTFHLPLSFLEREVDTYINLAKIKTHMETTVSLCLKNQMGLAAPLDRAQMHKTGLERAIARLATLCRPHLNILEGCPAMEGNGPHHGKARDFWLLAAGTDMLEIDSCLATLLGFMPERIPHFAHAAALGAGKLATSVLIEALSAFREADFRPAARAYHFGRKVSAWPTYACSRCITAVEQAGREFKRHPLKYWRFILRALLGRKPLQIVFGRADEAGAIARLADGGEVVCIGTCTAAFAEERGLPHLDRCPPGLRLGSGVRLTFLPFLPNGDGVDPSTPLQHASTITVSYGPTARA